MLSLHHVHSYSITSKHGKLSYSRTSSQVLHIPFRNCHFYSIHWVPLSLQPRPAFTSVQSSTPAANICARLACLPWLRVCLFFPTHKIYKQKKAKPLRITLLPTAVLLLHSHHLGRPSQPLPFVPHSSVFAGSLLQCQLLPGTALLLWPQALLPFIFTEGWYLNKKACKASRHAHSPYFYFSSKELRHKHMWLSLMAIIYSVPPLNESLCRLRDGFLFFFWFFSFGLKIFGIITSQESRQYL